MPQSKNVPEIRQLQGKIQIPYNVKPKTRTDEEGAEETYYEFDRLIIDQVQTPNLDQIKRYVSQALRGDLSKHIYTEYDQGNQATIQALAQKAERQSLTNVVDECEAIFDWVEATLDYYHMVRDDIVSAVDEGSVVQVIWDFVTNVPKPSTLKTRREIQGMFT